MIPSKDALDFIRKMQPKQARQVLFRILDLCQTPNPPDSKAVHGLSGNLHRVDFGEFRIAYRLQGDTLEILVVGKRNDDEVYRDLSRKKFPE
ncbi:MAG: type II toxin-antitoxin system RelE/ParE family toxin [Armatimonadota bacterium]|nr:type II toxin-antitoxin system RelE/ParE family toxin [Armatimonadota bacterium]